MTTERALQRVYKDRGATFSPCRRYRYALWRCWDERKPAMMVVLLNPSTADETENDPTVERCERRARRTGHGTLIVTNLYALRSTDPAALYAADDPVGPENDATILRSARTLWLPELYEPTGAAETVPIPQHQVLCGWGEHGERVRRGRPAALIALLRAIRSPVRCTPVALAVNQDGSPRHPLYVPYAAQPVPYEAR